MIELKCVICHKRIAYRFNLCSKCIEQYGKNRKLWPRWLRFLVKDERRLMRSNTKLKKHEINISALDRAQSYAIEAKLYGT